MENTKLSTYSRYAFFGISIINLFEQVIKTGWLDLVTKPLLMIALGLFYLFARNKKFNPLAGLMTGALVFSWCGDVLLMLQNRYANIFIFGLATFLIAHIFYILVYRKAKFENQGELNPSFVRTRIIFLIFIGSMLIFMLYSNLGEMLIPVILYTGVIITMGIFAVMRRGWTTDKSFIMVYSGALLFIMSDAMIGINRFLNPIVQARLLIMATYIAAQFLIVKGILIHENFEKESETINNT